MGNYAELYTSDSETPNYTLEEDNICLQAKYAIPAFWFLLFNSESYCYLTPIHRWEPDPEDTPDQLFIMEYGEALELYSQRESNLFEIVPSEWKSLSTQFIGFLKSKPLRFIHLNVSEIASMFDEKRYEEQVKYALDSLAHQPLVDPIGLFAKYRKPKIQDGWDTLLGLANISYKKMDKLNYWDLAGGDVAESAPWDES